MKTKRHDSLSNLAGLTLLEVFISMLIFGLLMAGLANLFIATRTHTTHTHARSVAGDLARYFLDRIQMQVRQDYWNNSPETNPPPPDGIGNFLSPINDPNSNYKTPNNPFSQYSTYLTLSWIDTPAEVAGEEPTVDGIRYYPVYEVSNKDGVRKLKLIVNWQE